MEEGDMRRVYEIFRELKKMNTRPRRNKINMKHLTGVEDWHTMTSRPKSTW